ncbi:MAG: hypothetical protein R3B72_14525 [Polyangiaceae bacterium]
MAPLVFVVGCGPGGSGGSGDPRTEPRADKYGSGVRLHEVLGARATLENGEPGFSWLDPDDMESASCTGIPRDQELMVTGLTLTAVDDFDETGAGAIGNYYAQDSAPPPVPHSGITIFNPGFSPPDLRVVAGDVLDAFGVLTEFGGPSSSPFRFCRTLPEMSGSLEFRFEGGEVEPATPPVADFARYATARPWIGMLVTLENVKTLESPNLSGAGRYSIRFDAGEQPAGEELPTLTNELMDLPAVIPEDTPAGTVIRRVTGVVTYFYQVHVSPRSAADIEL